MPKVKVKDVEKPEEASVAEETTMAEDNVEEEFPDENLGEEEEYDSYKRDPNEEVWEDGPTFGQVNALKEEHGDIYVTEYSPGKYVMWRTLTRFEYRRLVKNLEQALSTGQVSQAEANMNNEEAIAEMCIVWPGYSRSAPAESMAGLASTIAQQVMEASAFVSLDVRQL